MWLDGSVYENQRFSGNQHGWHTYGNPPTSSERRACVVTSQIKVIHDILVWQAGFDSPGIELESYSMCSYRGTDLGAQVRPAGGTRERGGA